MDASLEIRQTRSQRLVWNRLVRRPLLSFFVLANLVSWIAWAPLAAAGLNWTTLRFSPYLHFVGGLGPLVAALVVTGACDGRAGLLRLLDACIAVRSRLGWVAFAAAAPVLLFVVSAAVLRVAGQDQVAWADVGRSVEYPGLSRGVAPLLGAAWAAWHLPLFAFAGGLSSMGIAGAAGWLFSILTGSILMTWLFNASRGSILAAALFHGVLDIVMTSPVKGPLSSVMGAAITLLGLGAAFILARQTWVGSSRMPLYNRR